jgi:drug/metabolite transporter (DMT)-like permease
MNWILLTMLASISFAIANIIDKYIIVKWFKNPITPILTTGLVGLAASIFIYFVWGYSKLSYLEIMISIISGTLTMFAIYLYLKALKLEEISRVAALFYISPLFTLVLAAIFLHELLKPLNYVGVMLLVFGAILISIKSIKEIKVSKGFLYMLLGTFCIAISGVLQKYILGFSDVKTVFAYSRIGGFLFIIPILFLYSKDFINVVKTYGSKVILADIGTETTNLLGGIFMISAYAVGSVTLVNAISSVQPFFVLLFSVITTFFLTKHLEEDVRKGAILHKLIAIAIMFVGVLLIS